MASLYSEFGRRELTILEKIRGINWRLVLLICTAACFGFAVLYSAADGNIQPWAAKQMMRFAIGLMAMIAVALVDIRHWYRAAYWVYAIALALVVAVGLRGFVGMGAQRWIDLGVIQLQPSELMNVALVLALARYFSARSSEDTDNRRRPVVPRRDAPPDLSVVGAEHCGRDTDRLASPARLPEESDLYFPRSGQ